jgi:hypothetical protein
MREKRRKFNPEFKDEAVRLVIETSRSIARSPGRLMFMRAVSGPTWLTSSGFEGVSGR